MYECSRYYLSSFHSPNLVDFYSVFVIGKRLKVAEEEYYGILQRLDLMTCRVLQFVVVQFIAVSYVML